MKILTKLLLAAALTALLVLAVAPDVAAAPDSQVIKVEGNFELTGSPPGAESKPPVDPVVDAKGALAAGKGAVEDAKAGRWWHFSALAVMLLMFLAKLLGTKVWDFWPKLGRVRYILPPALALVAGLLATFQGGVSLEAAFAVFGESWATASLQELWEHGIRNKPRASAGG